MTRIAGFLPSAFDAMAAAGLSRQDAADAVEHPRVVVPRPLGARTYYGARVMVGLDEHDEVTFCVRLTDELQAQVEGRDG